MDIIIAGNATRRSTQAIEGPTRTQAVKLAEYRRGLLEQAKACMRAGEPERAFERDMEAWDIEDDLRNYGFGDLI